MSAMSKARSVSIRKDDTQRMEDEARRMEAKLEVMRKQLEVPDLVKSSSGGGEGGRWRSGAASKPLARGYVKGVLETPAARGPGGKPRGTSQQRGPHAGAAAAQPAAAAPEGTFSEIFASGEAGGAAAPASGHSPGAAVSGGRAGANLQAAVHQQSMDAKEVEAFLAGLNLDRYVSLFLEHGFDCMEVVQEMQESHMREIGMAAGHILKLRKRLGELAPAAAPAAEPAATELGSSAGTQRRVTFGRVKEAPSPGPAAAGSAGSKLSDGRFSEEESAASFQEALRAWREGKDDPGPAGPASARGGGPSSSPKAAPGSFWSTVGDSEMDLERASTPLRPPMGAAAAESEAQRDAAPGNEKLCCYQCYKQFYAKASDSERQSSLPETPGAARGGSARHLCSEACAAKWAVAEQAKAEALRKRQEQLDKMQELERALETEKQAVAVAAEAVAAEPATTPAQECPAESSPEPEFPSLLPAA